MADKSDAFKTPFNLYDFFGYIFPGAYLGLMFILVSESSDSRLMYLVRQSTAIVYQSSSVLSNIIGGSLLLVIAYSLGHIVATLSHIVIDRLLVSGIMGYPIYRLLNMKQPYDHMQLKRSTSTYILVVLLLILVTPVYHFFAGTTLALDERACPDLSTLCNPTYYSVLSTLILGLMLFKGLHAFVAVEPYYFEARKHLNHPWVEFGIKAYTFVARFALFPLLQVLETVLGTERRLPSEMVKKFGTDFRTRFDLDFEKAGTENYWLPFFRTNIDDPNATRLIFNWLHIYGFARNMGASCFMVLAYILYRFHMGQEGDYKMLLVLYTLNFFLMIFFIARYWMIYSTYFSKSILRSFYVSSIHLKRAIKNG